ncbi:MAG: beta-glucosidase [Rhodobacterales bacterium]|nr:beta-glucosidase [Rhodobacterales bacterium]NCT12254.1 beta-glucosidase [Rhodobacterales bacterium]
MTETRITALLDAMTLAEQVSLLSGADFWSLPGVERLGIGRLRVTDGPNGARGGGSLIGGVRSAAFPVGIALGATWHPALLHEIGAALAEEVKSKQAHVLLAPTVNIHRSVTNGRNFECYAEDPVLTAALAVAYITGLQENGIAATIKHFVGNESEIERTTISSEIDERTLRELYLVPFEAAVKQARTWAVMSSYNRLGGTYTSENGWLLNTVLRGDWGFDGVVMSDWFGSHSTAASVNGGLDLEMPGPARDRGEKLIAAVQDGAVSAATVRERARNILRLMARTGALDDHRPFAEAADDRPAHRALIRKAAAEGMVLLRNDGILPLTGAPRIAVIGPNAKVAQVMGGGSAQLNAHRRVSPWEGLVAALGEGALTYAPGCANEQFVPVMAGTLAVEYFDNTTWSGPVTATGHHTDAQGFWFGRIADGAIDAHRFSARFTGHFTPEADGLHEVGIRSTGPARVLIDGVPVIDIRETWTRGTSFFEEGCDEVRGSATLTAGKAHEVVIEFASRDAAVLAFSAFAMGIARPMGAAEIAQAAEVAAQADVALLFVGRDASWDTEGADLPGIAMPGQQDALIAAVIAANPRTVVVLQTGGPVEMPWADDAAAILQAWYPGQEAGHAIADVLLGAAEPAGRLPQSFPRRWADNATHSQDREVYPGLAGKVRYEEGLFIGYRHHDATGIPPLFPFGHGLSYTQFALSDLAVNDSAFAAEGRVSVSVSVQNTGARAGSTVVQLYVAPQDAPLRRPEKELKAFAKITLAPGQSQQVTLDLTARDFAFCDVAAGQWVVAPVGYDLRLGMSAADLPHRASVTRSTALHLPFSA